MKLITERDEIRTVANRWLAQYMKSFDRWPDKLDIQRKLDALNIETADRHEVAAIIGNDSWIDTRCDECGNVYPALIHIGDEPHYEARWQKLCSGCLRAALALLEQRE